MTDINRNAMILTSSSRPPVSGSSQDASYSVRSTYASSPEPPPSSACTSQAQGNPADTIFQLYGGEPIPKSPSPRVSNIKIERLQNLLAESTLNLGGLKELLWSGIPECAGHFRPEAWQLMLGYLPLNKDRRRAGLEKKRIEYWELIKEYHENECRSEGEKKLLRQIRVDLPRTNPRCQLFSHERVQAAMERVLYTWAVRHPASGYVQGINDLVTPFLIIFLTPYSQGDNLDVIDMSKVDENTFKNVEADCYWCLSKILGHIQDNYTQNQPGVQRLILRLKEIVKRIDEPLYSHLEIEGLDFLQFAFRWMNCLLMREFPMRCVIRLWDTYIAEQGEGFSTFHAYVCAVFLVYWSNQLKMMDFQQMMIFMQNFPTSQWTAQEIDTLLAEAFVLKSLFHASPKHFS